MNDTNYKEQMILLQKYFRFNLTPEYFTMYWNMLKHLDDEKFKLAVENIVKDFIPTTTVPFPLVVHFLRYCGDAGDNQAVSAISKLKQAIRSIGQYQSVNFNDPALHYTVNCFGGWTAICVWDEKEWDINEKRMLDTYKMAIANKYGIDEHLIGIAEKENGFYKIYSVKQNGSIALSYKNNPLQLKQSKEQLYLGNENEKDDEFVDISELFKNFKKIL